MNKKSNAAAIISYLTWVGFIIAILVGDRSDDFTRHHLNQALIINILSIVGGVVAVIPFLGSIVGGLISLVVVVFWCLGIFRAVTWSIEPLPLIGDIHLIG